VPRVPAITRGKRRQIPRIARNLHAKTETALPCPAMEVGLAWRTEEDGPLPVLVVRFPAPVRMISSAALGGGMGLRRWVINAQVPGTYVRRDPDAHLRQIAAGLGLAGPGVGMLTAADVRGDARRRRDDGVDVVATVGLGHPTRAAIPAGEEEAVPAAGTINLMAWVPVRLSDAALVNIVATVTEAKAQALADLGLDATGTATDAVCIACPPSGAPEPFGGPRSEWGARLARAVHAAVLGR
jgi:adenosylcobinamide hydrolase